MAIKKQYTPAVLSVGLEVVDRKNLNKVGVVTELTDSEAKVTWADGTVWSYLENNKRFLQKFTGKEPRVFRKEKVAA